KVWVGAPRRWSSACCPRHVSRTAAPAHAARHSRGRVRTGAEADGPVARVCHNHPMSPSRVSFGRDTGLQARMLLTMFLLGLVYAVFVGVLFAAGAGAGFIVVFAVVLLLLQLFP